MDDIEQSGHRPSVDPEDEQRLRRVDGDIVGLLGRETVLDIERTLDALAGFDELRTLPNPFERDRRPAVIDISFINPEQAAFLKPKNGTRSKSEEARVQKSNYRQLNHRRWRLQKMVRNIPEDMRKQMNRAAQAFTEYEDEAMAAAKDWQNGQPLELAVCSRYLSGLSEVSELLPTQADVDLLMALSLFEIELTEYDSKKGPGSRFMFGAGHKGTLGLKQIWHRRGPVKALERRQALGGEGRRRFSEFQQLVGAEEQQRIQGLLFGITDAKQALEGVFLSGEQTEAAVRAEAYLTDISTRAYALFKRIGAEHGLGIDPRELKDIENKISPLMKTVLTHEMHQRRQAQLVEQAKGLNSQLTLAKDVLRGGRRLAEDKRDRNLQDQIDRLQRVKDQAGQRLFSPEERGFITAAMLDRLEPMLEVVDRVKAAEPDASLEALSQTRGDVINELRRFDADGTLRRLNLILTTYPYRGIHSEIRDIIGAEAADKVRTAISACLLKRLQTGDSIGPA